ncbi:glycosyltransferase family 2 protein [uncultured Alistipes sp.]|uniref:glycosyltransferase family 2 protein n=1 Tax=uncultured Alistipes sp. TaxID=538949 RepID=UPI0025CCD7EC|nr:glycosyltransferase family 2 protein [uncultured Alistipes sp.]
MFSAGIVLYNPEPDRLDENVKALAGQVDFIVLVDNGSANFASIQERYSADPAIRFIRNEENRGIAAALNQICRFASEQGAAWVLTMDQDSVVAPDLIAIYAKYTDQEDLGIICPAIRDRNFSLQRELDLTGQVRQVQLCITSGSLTNVKAWARVGGFDEKLFIDSVDYDFCFALGANNYRILKTYETYILHEVGKSKLVRFLGKEDSVYNHSPLRYYYIFRNRIYVGRKYGRLLKNMSQLLKRFYLVMRHEKNRGAKFRSMCRGVKDGFLMKL